MSTAAMKELDTALFKILKKSAGKFREFYSDKKCHVVTLNVVDTVGQTWEEMARREGYKTRKDFEKVLSTDAYPEGAKAELTDTINTNCKTLHNTLLSDMKAAKTKDKKSWSIDFKPLNPTAQTMYTVTIRTVGKKGNVFKKFKSFKADAQRPLIKAINTWNETYSNRGVGKARPEESNQIRRKTKNKETGKMEGSNDPFIDVGHMKGSEIGKLRALAARDFLNGWICEDSACETAKNAAITALQDTVEWVYKEKKSFKGELEKNVKCQMESSRINKASMSKGEVAGLNNALFLAMGKVRTDKGWVYGKGSDSFFDMVEKTVLAKLMSGFGKNKNVKLSGKKVKYKERTSGSTTTKGTKRKVGAKKLTGPKYRKVPITRLRKPTDEDGGASGAFAPLQMIGLINKELPEAVENNMGRPRLESVTGRFARSTKITDIISTPQGFPSIGYTYQLSPYQTFEKDDDYDPRTLIDQSIRAIAMKFAMGRFYTRREG